MGSAFQDFQIFSLSVEDNVAMGNAVWGGDPRAAALDALARSGVAGRIGEPVSYTHLDVYKRQSTAFAMPAEAHGT